MLGREPIIPPLNQNLRNAVIQTMYPDAEPMDLDGLKWSLPCPGLHLHNLAKGVARKEDCNIYENKRADGEKMVIMVCMHKSCKDLVTSHSRKLRAAIYKAEMMAAGLWKETGSKKPTGPPLPACQKMLGSIAAKTGQIRLEERKAELVTLKNSALACQPMALNQDPETPAALQSRRQLEHLYTPDDWIWSGEVFYKGPPVKVSYLHQLLDWGIPPAPFITQCRFKPETPGRLNEWIESTPWLVLEADWETPRDGITGGEWTLRLGQALSEMGVKPRVVVDTGGKSIHVWVSRSAFLEKMGLATVDGSTRNAMIREILGIDSAPFTLSQPVRLAGVHGNRPDGTPRARPASLLYLQPVTETTP